MQLAVTYSKCIRMKACPTMTVRNKSKTQMTLTEVKHKDAESNGVFYPQLANTGEEVPRDNYGSKRTGVND